ncbi:DUF4214 domain-containing protein [Pseudoxanthomonas gei]|uniref:DUF4214 domain-containing protein n=1 Tax=Pseudoxanthomonas gei TaxID=1383030 RepID=A0ABX0A9Z4_9GAMM|nr:DUF4214 domain-containing protein [Pseudoxanthomonas gei]NDK38354.1 DUF4214 domain-containing protein [Pseudoxanthomonas gei]
MSPPPQVNPAAPVQALSVDEIMAQVRGEVIRRGGSLPEAVAAAAPQAHAAGLARWQPSAPRIAMKREYALPELLSFSDRDFIENAYRAVLRRAPDDTGVVHYLERLRDGRLSKVEVLAALRWSPEGEKEGVHVDGLLAPFLLQKWRRKPLLGPVLGWVHSLARLARVSDRQSILDAAQARETHELGRVVNLQAQQLEQRFARLEATLATHDVSLQAERERSHAAAEALASQLQQLRTQASAQEMALAQARARLDEISGVFTKQLMALSARLDDLSAVRPQVEALGHDLDALAARVEAAPDVVPVIRLLAERLERLSGQGASLGGRVSENSQVPSEKSAVAARKVS